MTFSDKKRFNLGGPDELAYYRHISKKENFTRKFNTVETCWGFERQFSFFVTLRVTAFSGNIKTLNHCKPLDDNFFCGERFEKFLQFLAKRCNSSQICEHCDIFTKTRYQCSCMAVDTSWHVYNWEHTENVENKSVQYSKTVYWQNETGTSYCKNMKQSQRTREISESSTCQTFAPLSPINFYMCALCMEAP